MKMKSREERGLKDFENGLQSGMFGLKRERVTWAGQTCVMRSFMVRTVVRWRRNVARMREKIRAGFWLGSCRFSLEGNASKYVTDTGCQRVEWVCLAQGRELL